MCTAAASLTGPFAPPPPPHRHQCRLQPSRRRWHPTDAYRHPTVTSAVPPSGDRSHHGAAASAGVSPLVYHAPTPTTPATPATQPSSNAAESMIVRTQRGVFLLQPAAASAAAPAGSRASQSPCTQGASPPVSPLPSYALPPALPASSVW